MSCSATKLDFLSSVLLATPPVLLLLLLLFIAGVVLVFVGTTFIVQVNADLADSLGNLLSRCTAAKILPSGVISCNAADLRLGERERRILTDLQNVRTSSQVVVVGSASSTRQSYLQTRAQSTLYRKWSRALWGDPYSAMHVVPDRRLFVIVRFVTGVFYACACCMLHEVA